MGIAPVAVYSDADYGAMHALMAAEWDGDAVRIGPGPARESYLNVEAILEATAIDRGPVGWDQKFGYGRIDAGEAARVAALRAKAACGLGFELALVLPALAALRSRRITSPACRSSSR